MQQVQRILIIDDEPDIREFIGYNLSRKGYEVFTAPEGHSGLHLARECKPHLILLDILMPVMNGYETCKRLREDPAFDSTRILFLSALSESYTRELGCQLAADGYICKPLRINALVETIESWLQKSA